MAEQGLIDMTIREDNRIAEVSARDTVQVHLPDGRVLEGRRGTHLGEFLTEIDDLQAPIVGAIVESELRELTYSILTDVQVSPVTMASPDGMRIYRRSLTFLLAAVLVHADPGQSFVRTWLGRLGVERRGTAGPHISSDWRDERRAVPPTGCYFKFFSMVQYHRLPSGCAYLVLFLHCRIHRRWPSSIRGLHGRIPGMGCGLAEPVLYSALGTVGRRRPRSGV